VRHMHYNELNTPWVHELAALCQIGTWTWKPDIQPLELAYLFTPGPTRFCMVWMTVLFSWFKKKERYNWNWLKFKTGTHVKLGFYQPTPRQFLGQHRRRGRDRSIQLTSLYCIAHLQKYMSSGTHGGLGDDTPHVDHRE
jgi:hypothetical protein